MYHSPFSCYRIIITPILKLGRPCQWDLDERVFIKIPGNRTISLINREVKLFSPYGKPVFNNSDVWIGERFSLTTVDNSDYSEAGTMKYL
jgi:hypothetical protein